jgi:hypothetical protein
VTKKCKKRWYLNGADAEKERQRLIATATDKPRAKQLAVYVCRDCNLYHVGHLRRRFRDMPKLTPAPAPAATKPQTAAQLRRAGKRLEKDNARTARHNMRQAGWEVDSLEVAADRAKDFLDSYQHALRMRDELFAGKRKA